MVSLLGMNRHYILAKTFTKSLVPGKKKHFRRKKCIKQFFALQAVVDVGMLCLCIDRPGTEFLKYIRRRNCEIIGAFLFLTTASC
jgi:hypothetical protein